MPSLCRVKLPVSSDWFDPSISHSIHAVQRPYL